MNGEKEDRFYCYPSLDIQLPNHRTQALVLCYMPGRGQVGMTEFCIWRCPARHTGGYRTGVFGVWINRRHIGSGEGKFIPPGGVTRRPVDIGIQAKTTNHAFYGARRVRGTVDRRRDCLPLF